jgi:ParE toxin of type II toxin-antitoxin system, parDE
VSLPVKLGEHVKADLAALSQPLLLEAFQLMATLADKPLKGRELDWHPEVGDLSDCRKLYFNKAQHRVIYHVTPNEQNPTAVRVIVVGRRANLAVYYEAAKRLGRTPGDDAPLS